MVVIKQKLGISKIELEKGQHTCTLQSFDVLGALGELSNGLHEGDSGFLIDLKGG